MPAAGHRDPHLSLRRNDFSPARAPPFSLFWARNAGFWNKTSDLTHREKRAPLDGPARRSAFFTPVGRLKPDSPALVWRRTLRFVPLHCGRTSKPPYAWLSLLRRSSQTRARRGGVGLTGRPSRVVASLLK